MLAASILGAALLAGTAFANGCVHGPSTRGCWNGTYGVWTDMDEEWPKTGVTRTYNLHVTNTTCNPDGAKSRTCLLINGQFPGPTLWANWGDTFSVNVFNDMKDNGTAMHWHGIRQLRTNIMDGTGGITECPIAPGQNLTYEFEASQHGTAWYHSHFLGQYGDGVLGPMVIYGPSSYNYDYDLGPLTVQDWVYSTAFQYDAVTFNNLQQQKVPPPLDTVLVNGTGKSKTGTGSYKTAKVQQNKAYLLRFINTGIDTPLRVSIDNHSMIVTTADFIPVVPYPVSSILVNVGQRYNIIFNATKPVGNYWLRADVDKACMSANNNPSGRFIISYNGAPAGNPTTNSSVTTSSCRDLEPLIPLNPNTAGNETEFKQQAKNFGVDVLPPGVAGNNKNIVTWSINLTNIAITWDKPTLSYVMEGNLNFPKSQNLIRIDQPNIWTYYIIQEQAGTLVPIEHPIHLHGHDFSLLGSGVGQFNLSSDPDKLNFNNPTRRDTVTLPAMGWVVIAFKSDNPGAWLMHCHIAAHISEGMGLQFLEQVSAINGTFPSLAVYKHQCDTWKSYYATSKYKQGELSGLKARNMSPRKGLTLGGEGLSLGP